MSITRRLPMRPAAVPLHIEPECAGRVARVQLVVVRAPRRRAFPWRVLAFVIACAAVLATLALR